MYGFELISSESRLINIELKAIKLFFRDRYSLFTQIRCTFILIFSYLFLPLPLRELPKAFSLSYEKTFFPYGRLTPELYNLVTEWPRKEEFELAGLSHEDMTAFHLWYDKAEQDYHGQFDSSVILEDYCKSDTLVLLSACVKYRDLMGQICENVNVFSASSTLSSFLNKVHDQHAV